MILAEIRALQAVVLPSLKCDLHPSAFKMTAGVPAITSSTQTKSKGDSDDEEVIDDSECLLYKGCFLEDAPNNNLNLQVIRSCHMAIPHARKVGNMGFFYKEKILLIP